MTEDLSQVMLAVAALVVVLVVGLVGVILVRWRFRKMQQDVSAEPFTLEQLRELHRRGELTEQEYARAKAGLIDRVGLDRGGDRDLTERQHRRENLGSEEGTSSS